MKTIFKVINQINRDHNEVVRATSYAFAGALGMDPEAMDKIERETLRAFVEAFITHSKDEIEISGEMAAYLLLDLDPWSNDPRGPVHQMIKAIKKLRRGKAA